MKIGNREYGFRLTVGASIQIARLCPNGDLSQIEKAIGKGYGEQADVMAKLIVALNNGYCDAEAFEGRKANRLTLDNVLSLSPALFAEMSAEAIRAFSGDVDGEIEVESAKKAAAEG